MMSVKNQQSDAFNIIVSAHMVEADTKRHLAPPRIPIEIYGHSTGPDGLRATNKARTIIDVRMSVIDDGGTELWCERLRNGDDNNESATARWCARQRSSVFHAIRCLIFCLISTLDFLFRRTVARAPLRGWHRHIEMNEFLNEIF